MLPDSQLPGGTVQMLGTLVPDHILQPVGCHLAGIQRSIAVELRVSCDLLPETIISENALYAAQDRGLANIACI